MKTIAYYALHYGSEYLAWSVRSVMKHVDEIHVLYTEKPSFGRDTGLVCPDTEARLRTEALRFLDKPEKLHWHRVTAHAEGAHRDQLRKLCPDAGLVLHVDADELWDGRTLADCLAEARDSSYWSLRARFVHFWRSFDWVCQDAAMPERIFNWRNSPQLKDGYLSGRAQHMPVLHFGYAQSEELMRYKWQIHGHQDELRKGWFEEKFLGWKPGIDDVHPTCDQGFWMPKGTLVHAGLLTSVHDLLRDHPYFGKDLIR